MIPHLIRASVLVVLATSTASLVACGDDDGKKCSAGEANCACLEGNTCKDDLSCMAGTCQGTFEASVSVSDKRARGCDVLVTEQTARVQDVTFTDEVKGSFVREAPKVALSFISTSDQAIDASGIQLRLVGAGTEGLEVQSVACADGAGKPLEGVKISLRQ